MGISSNDRQADAWKSASGNWLVHGFGYARYKRRTAIPSATHQEHPSTAGQSKRKQSKDKRLAVHFKGKSTCTWYAYINNHSTQQFAYYTISILSALQPIINSPYAQCPLVQNFKNLLPAVNTIQVAGSSIDSIVSSHAVFIRLVPELCALGWLWGK